MVTSDKNAKPAKRDWLRKPSVLITLIILVIVALYIGFAAWNIVDNRAADLAAPLERSLAASGATKKCDGGDPGRGPDNTEPYYGATYDVQMSEADAIVLANRIAKDNGYNLTHASPSNHGYLNVPDDYIDKWYFDDSKQQPYGDIEAGPIELSFTVEGPGSKACKTSYTTPSGHALISFSFDLPDFKQQSSNSHIDFSR